MTHPRAALREAIAARLEMMIELADATRIRSWTGSVDAGTLPVWGVATPREVVNKVAVRQVTRVSEVHVVYATLGDEEIEDTLDDVAAAIEPEVLDVLNESEAMLYALDTIDMRISLDGSRRQGLVRLVFQASRAAPEGAQTND